MCPPFPHRPQPTSPFPPSFPTAQAIVQPDYRFCFNQTILPPPSDIKVWTDGSVPSLFGPSGAGVYVTCSKCNTSNSLSFSTGPIASSFTAEAFALKQGLDLCTSHLLTCKLQSVPFLTDSQSTLSILSSAPSYLLPESLWNVWSLASSLSNNTPCASNGSPVTLVHPVMKMRIYLPKLVPLCPLTRSHALSLSHCQNPLFSVPQLKTSHLPRLYEPLSPQSLFGGTSPFSPYLL